MADSNPSFPAIDRKLDVVQELCDRHGLQRLYVFHATPPSTDGTYELVFDFAIEYPNDFDAGSWGHRWVEFLERMHLIFGNDVSLYPVSNISRPIAARHFNETKRIVYERAGSPPVQETVSITPY